MCRLVRFAIVCALVLLPQGGAFLSAQTGGGAFPPGTEFYGGQIISSAPYPMIQEGAVIQGMPISGDPVPVPPGGDLNSLSGTILPYDSPLLSQFGAGDGQPYGPNNPPPVVDVSHRNRRDNGVVKPQEVPAPDVLLSALTRQLDLWSPHTVLVNSDLTPATVLKMTVPYGIDTQFLCQTGGQAQSVPKNGKVQPPAEPAYAVGLLCWNLPIGQRRIFNPAGDLLVPRIGYGYQQTRGELLASLAMANVSLGYEIKANPGRTMTVRDLMESEMKQMTFHEDLSMMAVALSFYLDDVHRVWQNAFGEPVTLAALAEYELNRPVYWNRSESVNRLLGLAYLSDRLYRETRKGNGDPQLRDLLERIDENLKTVYRRALDGLNDAGLRETRFLSGRKISSAADMLLVNGHFLRWHLAASERFPVNSQSLRKSIYHLALTLAQFYNPKTDPIWSLSPKEVEAISVTLHALRLYVKKYTKTPEDPEPAEEEPGAGGLNAAEPVPESSEAAGPESDTASE